MRRRAIVFLYLFNFLLISACRQHNSLLDLRHYVVALKRRPPIAIAKLPDFHLGTVIKTPQHLQHDPFSAVTTQPHSRQQSHVLANIKLVGTIIQQQHRLALLKTPQGIVPVIPGQIIGSKSIKVITIMPKYIELQHTSKQQIRRSFTLKLEQQ